MTWSYSRWLAWFAVCSCVIGCRSRIAASPTTLPTLRERANAPRPAEQRDGASTLVEPVPSLVAAAARGPGWLGIGMAAAPIGVRVTKVVRRSPAALAGVLLEDRIVAVDGLPVTTPPTVSARVGASTSGATLLLSLQRNGVALSLPVTLAPRPELDDILRLDLLGEKAPEWKRLVAVAGAKSELAQYTGNVVVLDFWATWCGPCRMTLPRLSDLYNRYAPEGLAVVGVSTEELSKVASFAVKAGLSYPLLVDEQSETSRLYGVSSLPSMILIDRSGIVREVFVGVPQPLQLEHRIRELLASSPQGARLSPQPQP
jgi:peroxiredoxin